MSKESYVQHSSHDLQPPAVFVNSAESRAVIIMTLMIHATHAIQDDADNSVLVNLDAHARLVYTTRLDNGLWKLYSTDAIYMYDSLQTAVPGQIVKVDTAKVCKPFSTMSIPLICLDTRSRTYARATPCFNGHFLRPAIPSETICLARIGLRRSRKF